MKFTPDDVYRAFVSTNLQLVPPERQSQIAIGLATQNMEVGVQYDADAILIAAPISLAKRYKGIVETTTALYVALLRGGWDAEGNRTPTVCFGGSDGMQDFFASYFPDDQPAIVEACLREFAQASLPLLNDDMTSLRILRASNTELWRSFRAPKGIPIQPDADRLSTWENFAPSIN